MACPRLAARYAKETGHTVPSGFDQKWLHSERWTCKNSHFKCKSAANPGGVDCESDGFPSTAWCLEGENNLDVPSGDAPNAPLNILLEEGFVPWVNQHGFQCVNKVMGRINPLDEHGQLLEPDQNTEQQTTGCASVCSKASRGSLVCFECVKKFLKDEPGRCPTAVRSDPTLLEDCVDCMTCMGENHESFESLWRCVNDTVPAEGLSEVDYMAIAFGSIILVAIMGALAYVLIRKNQKKKPSPPLTVAPQVPVTK